MRTRTDSVALSASVDRILKHTRVIPWEADANTWRMTHVGEQAEAVLGYPVEEWYRDNFWSDHIHPEDRDWVIAFCEEHSMTDTDYEFEYRFIRKDGANVWLHDVVSVERENGAPKTLQGYMIDISDRKRTEGALKAELEHHREDLSLLIERMSLAVKISSLGIWDYDPKENSTIWDAKMFEIYGVEKKIPVPYGEWSCLVHPDDLPIAEVFMQKHIESMAENSVEFRILRPDGELRHVYAVKTVVFDDAGAVVRVVGFCSDITERKEFEIELQRVFEYLDTVLLNLPTGVAILEGPEFKYFRINRILAEYNGLDVKDHLGRPLNEVLPEAAADILPRLQKVLETGKPSLDFEFSTRLPKDPDEIRHFVDSFFPIKDEDGKIRAVGAVVRDVTEEKRVAKQLDRAMQDLHLANQNLEQKVRARTENLEREISERKEVEEALRKSESRLRLLLASTAEAIYGLDRSGRCTFANAACLETLGYSQLNELLGQNMHDLIHHTRADGSAYPESECLIYKAFKLDQGTHVDDEVLWRKDGTSFPAEYWSYPIKEGLALKGSVVTFVDITERRKNEVEVRTLREQIAHVSRVSSLGELSTSLAHELNQPLAAIMSNAQAATRLLAQPDLHIDDALDALSDIVNDTTRAGSIIASLRKFLRRNEPEMLPLSINELANDMFNLVHSDSILENISVSLDLDPALPKICGDRTQLQQVLLNLILNAKDAISNGSDSDRKIGIRTTQSVSGDVTLTVSDSGPGLSAESLEKLFEPFYTTKANGVGIGLSISRSIVESHNGRIWAESPSGGGVTFTFALPAYVEEKA